jgi:hypothetical protein
MTFGFGVFVGFLLGAWYAAWHVARRSVIRDRVLAYLAKHEAARLGLDIIHGAPIPRWDAYPRLAWMEDEGFITSFAEEDASDGHVPRRRYFLTTKGRRCVP